MLNSHITKGKEKGPTTILESQAKNIFIFKKLEIKKAKKANGT